MYAYDVYIILALKEKTVPQAYQPVRVTAEAYEALVSIRQSMLRAAEAGQLDVPLDNRDRLSLSNVILRLYNLYVTHADRKRQHARRKRMRADNVKTGWVSGDGDKPNASNGQQQSQADQSEDNVI